MRSGRNTAAGGGDGCLTQWGGGVRDRPAVGGGQRIAGRRKTQTGKPKNKPKNKEKATEARSSGK